MSKFKEGDLVKIIDDKTPAKSGAHLVGLIGTITDVRKGTDNYWAGSDYKYTIEVEYQGETRSILANKDELELVEMLNEEPMAKLQLEFTPVKGNPEVFGIGSTVEVDVDMPHSQWHKAQGIVMDKPYSDGKYKVKLIKDGPNGRLRDLIGSTCLLTGLSRLHKLPIVSTEKYTGSKKGVAHYAAGMPEGIEPMDIIRTQGWAKHFAYGNALKYLCRAPHKGTELVDVNKAIDYLKEVANILEKEQA